MKDIWRTDCPFLKPSSILTSLCEASVILDTPVSNEICEPGIAALNVCDKESLNALSHSYDAMTARPALRKTSREAETSR